MGRLCLYFERIERFTQGINVIFYERFFVLVLIVERLDMFIKFLKLSGKSLLLFI